MERMIELFIECFWKDFGLLLVIVCVYNSFVKCLKKWMLYVKCLVCFMNKFKVKSLNGLVCG